jgi:choline dehydrogenase-like flavoprotein
MTIQDMNKEQIEGFQPIDFNSKNGRRWGTYQAFLEPILGRPNLHVSRYSTATKIHLDINKRAHGVTYTRHGVTRYAEARKEIILSAGIFESARLLMLSGIGNRNDLLSVGIEPIIDLPVGQNLRDHLGVTIQFNFNKNISFVPERDLTAEIEEEYLEHGTGIYRNTFGILGYMSTNDNDHRDFPDVQYFIQHQADPRPDPNLVNITRPDSNIVAVFLVRPQAAPGFIKLKSSDPYDQLIIDPKYGSDPVDIRRMAKGIQFIVDFYENSSTYQEIGGAKLDESNFPDACKIFEYRSLEYFECLVRHWGATGHHFTGTCSLNWVLDSKLRVYHTTGLRVADASIMPTLPNGNTNAPAMIGERAAQLILREL